MKNHNSNGGGGGNIIIPIPTSSSSAISLENVNVNPNQNNLSFKYDKCTKTKGKTRPNANKKMKMKMKTKPSPQQKQINQSHHPWTEVEDQRLKEAVELFGAKSWKKIGEYVASRSKVQCLHRWRKVINPELTRGPWTKDEDERLINLINQIKPGHWSEIAANMKGRTDKQCRERWTNALDPSLSKEEFSRDEIDKIFKLHSKLGNKWAEIAHHLKGRSDNSVKNFWHRYFGSKFDTNNKENLENYIDQIAHRISVRKSRRNQTPVLRTNESSDFYCQKSSQSQSQFINQPQPLHPHQSHFIEEHASSRLPDGIRSSYNAISQSFTSNTMEGCPKVTRTGPIEVESSMPPSVWTESQREGTNVLDENFTMNFASPPAMKKRKHGHEQQHTQITASSTPLSKIFRHSSPSTTPFSPSMFLNTPYRKTPCRSVDSQFLSHDQKPLFMSPFSANYQKQIFASPFPEKKSDMASIGSGTEIPTEPSTIFALRPEEGFVPLVPNNDNQSSSFSYTQSFLPTGPMMCPMPVNHENYMNPSNLSFSSPNSNLGFRGPIPANHENHMNPSSRPFSSPNSNLGFRGISMTEQKCFEPRGLTLGHTPLHVELFSTDPTTNRSSGDILVDRPNGASNNGFMPIPTLGQQLNVINTRISQAAKEQRRLSISESNSSSFMHSNGLLLYRNPCAIKEILYPTFFYINFYGSYC